MIKVRLPQPSAASRKRRCKQALPVAMAVSLCMLSAGIGHAASVDASSVDTLLASMRLGVPGAMSTPLRPAVAAEPVLAFAGAAAGRDIGASASQHQPCAARIDAIDGACSTEPAAFERKEKQKRSKREGNSGLPWRSGASCAAGFANWRGRPLDVATNWAPFTSWGAFENFFQRSAGYANGLGATASIGLPMLTNESRGRFTDCAAGKFDSHYRGAATRLVAAGAGDAIIRVGWEANASWSPWSIGNQSAAYKACFARISGIFRGVSSGFKIEWPMIKKGRVLPVTQAYPGDGVVDYVGISYYDRYPVNASQSVWNGQLNVTQEGGPSGIGAWLHFAQSHGKKLSVPEWGVDDGYQQSDSGRGFDNPVYIQNMISFFRANAGSLAYESYFNCAKGNPGSYVIYPSKYNPRASAAYLAGMR